MERQHKAISELIGFNHNMHAGMQSLHARVTQLERSVPYSQTTTMTAATNGPYATFAAAGNNVPDANGPKSPPTQNESKGLGTMSRKRSFRTDGNVLPGRTKYRKKLQVKIPDQNLDRAPAVGLPTPMLSVSQLSGQ